MAQIRIEGLWSKGRIEKKGASTEEREDHTRLNLEGETAVHCGQPKVRQFA